MLEKLKEKPLLNLLIIPIQIVISIGLCYILLFIDSLLAKPSTTGTPFPVLFVISMPVIAFITVTMSILAIVRTIKYSIALRKKDEDEY